MTAFTVMKIKCIACGEEWNGAFYDYAIQEKRMMEPLCKKCFSKVKRFIKSIKK